MTILTLALLLTIAILFMTITVVWRANSNPEPTIQRNHAGNNLPVFSPLAGTALPSKEVPEAALARGNVGQVVAIRPSSGAMFAPFDATVVVLPTGRAIRLRHANGVRLLIHVDGRADKFDGVNFDVKVSSGQQVRAGDLLMCFDLAAIEDADYDAIVTLTLLCDDRCRRLTLISSGEIAQGEALFVAQAI